MNGAQTLMSGPPAEYYATNFTLHDEISRSSIR
jgi:hypothetical protein